MEGQRWSDESIRAGKLPQVSWEKIVEHIDHAVRLVGADHVGFGSDFDGAFMPEGMEDASKFPLITEGLLRRGYAEADIRKILGENTLRVMDEVAQASACGGLVLQANPAGRFSARKATDKPPAERRRYRICGLVKRRESRHNMRRSYQLENPKMRYFFKIAILVCACSIFSCCRQLRRHLRLRQRSPRHAAKAPAARGPRPTILLCCIPRPYRAKLPRSTT